jgi:hypothetical protein
MSKYFNAPSSELEATVKGMERVVRIEQMIAYTSGLTLGVMAAVLVHCFLITPVKKIHKGTVKTMSEMPANITGSH